MTTAVLKADLSSVPPPIPTGTYSPGGMFIHVDVADMHVPDAEEVVRATEAFITGGTVTIATVSRAGVTGTLDQVTFRDGSTLAGSFQAGYCPFAGDVCAWKDAGDCLTIQGFQ